MRICKNCGKEIVGRNSRAIYCSIECNRDADRKRKVIRWDKKYGIGEVRTCENCGQEFVTRSRRSRFCTRKCQNNKYSCEYQKLHGGGKSRVPKNQRVDNDISLRKLYQRDNGICYICGMLCDWNDISNGRPHRFYPSIDHVIPISKGGLHSWDNVMLSHITCNCSKQAKIIN